MLRPRCLLPFLGLCLLIGLGMRCDARAVNVSNTWTMPQEGLNVFYRFFRDRISWFEADAVCQFHHANLVTVDNSFQFDATRDLLRELDVNDIVWIGLMRPQNSDRFMWSNSRPLVADTGYWAESLPLMDAPLCAVIDPIRDYRWHALRCGGPETASFLCEMPVPSWADACILKDMPNLTMQYMADTASIELIRNCQEEGLLRHTCKGKEDRERAIRQLICPKERLEAQRINDITNSHFKSLQIINNIRTDNKENNDIDLLPNYGRRSGMAINIEVAPPVPAVSVPGLGELMQADAPGAVSLSGLYRIPDLVPKPVKKAAKKVITPDFAKKLQGSHQQQQQQHSQQQQQQQQKSRKSLVHQQQHEEEELMLGDQPALSEEQLPPGMGMGMGLRIPLNEDDNSNSDVSNEIFEHLPHKKKILPQDLRTMSPIGEAGESLMVTTTTLKTTTLAAPATATTTTTPATTTLAITTTAAATTEVQMTTPKAVDTTSSQAPATTIRPTTTVSSTTITTTTTTTTTTPQPELTTTTTKKPEPTTMVAPRTTKTSTTAAATSSMATTTTATSAATPPPATATTASRATSTDSSNSNNMAHPIHPSQQQQHHQQQILHEGSTLQQQHATHVNESADNTRFIPPMLLVKSHYVPPAKHASEHATTTTTLATTTTRATTAAAAAKPATPAAISAKEEIQSSTVTSSKGLTAAATATAATTTVTATTGATVEVTTGVKVPEDTAATSATTAATVIASESPAAAATTPNAVRPTAANEIKSNATAATPAGRPATTAATSAVKPATTPIPKQETVFRYPPLNQGSFKVDNNGMGSPEEQDDDQEVGHSEVEAATTRHNFLEETEAPFKPNRRRSLTKPETVSYFKKILG
ncbi:mucin-5AC [Drosophila gunungcola]|uniref:mucin-5AC n=1 Tax=Drosophila gunungcola TaxID=103775 RepID=UPI0022E0C62F|nr:mucin-5AC [Drosophila gunungcola]XP_052856551.1 mucin-5AC [Drosophila gunungcola]XP_052856552.1 mucin-5AC [Drosophila gunungcola]